MRGSNWNSNLFEFEFDFKFEIKIPNETDKKKRKKWFTKKSIKISPIQKMPIKLNLFEKKDKKQWEEIKQTNQID